ncbi:MAG: cupin domain-containing protein [bacterium]|nr:cupin domain-containing protein [bacterium]
MGFINLEQEPVIEPAPGVRLRTPYGDRLMLSLVEIDSGGEVPLHEHPHEQGGVVLQGKMRLTIGDESRVLNSGQMYIIPGNTPHRAIAVDGPVVVMDVFSPIREDYAKRENTFMSPKT